MKAEMGFGRDIPMTTVLFPPLAKRSARIWSLSECGATRPSPDPDPEPQTLWLLVPLRNITLRTCVHDAPFVDQFALDRVGGLKHKDVIENWFILPARYWNPRSFSGRRCTGCIGGAQDRALRSTGRTRDPGQVAAG